MKHLLQNHQIQTQVTIKGEILCSVYQRNMCDSEAKSVTISRMQQNLQEWDKQFKEILEKKEKNGKLLCIIIDHHNDVLTVCRCSLQYRNEKA